MALTGQERPTCDYCEHPVTERFWYVINGDTICRQCLFEHFRREAQDGADEEGDDE